MFKKLKPKPQQPALPPTPLSAQQQALEEEARKLKEKLDRYKKLVDEAPRIARERERVRRDELISRASRTEARRGSRTALPDSRHADENVLRATLPQTQGRRLRSERKQGRTLFIFLLITLAGVMGWLYYTIAQG